MLVLWVVFTHNVNISCVGRYRSIDQCVINNAELPTSGSRADSLINNATSVCRANGLILVKVSMEIVLLYGLMVFSPMVD